jgi:hypothetical protein
MSMSAFLVKFRVSNLQASVPMIVWCSNTVLYWLTSFHHLLFSVPICLEGTLTVVSIRAILYKIYEPVDVYSLVCDIHATICYASFESYDQ